MTETAIIRPQTLNLQAIDLCNSRCIMCNIWKDGRRERLTLEEFRRELARPFYSEVRFVGVTGGEPTLRNDLAELYALLPQCLPRLKGASFITHGLQTERAVQTYSTVNDLYRSRNLTFDGMVSLDGVGPVHDRVRGREGAFAAAAQTLLRLKARGVNTLATCTIVRSNVYGLHDLLDWGRDHGVYIRYRVAEFIRRLYNDGCADEVRAFTPRERRHLVSFYHVLLEYETNETIRKTYTSVLSLLTGGRRLIGCPYQRGRDVNVDSRGWLACCAPKGDSFKAEGDAAEIHSVLAAQRREVTRAHCGDCIHDYHDDWNEAAALEIARARDRSRQLYEVSEEELTTAEMPAQPFAPAGMKELLLAGWYGTETAGDIAILQGIIGEYLAVNPRLQFQVLSLFPYYTRTTVALWPEDLRSRVRVIDYASEAAWQATLDCDALVMAGGPLMDIADTRKILCLFKRFADLGKPRVIEGCGVGPLNRADYRWNVCRIARLATKISVRDRASRDHLRLYGIRKPVDVRPDPAVTFIRAQGVRHHGLEAKVIRCFLRELTSEYPQATSPDQAAQYLESLLRRLLMWYPEHRIELWAMHHFPVGWDDRLFARQLVRQIGDPRLVCDWEPRTPREILEAMAAADFCVCMRFHSCVFASEVGAPFLAIDYTAGGKIKAFFDDRRQEGRVCGLGDLPQLDREQFEARVRLAVAGESTSSAVFPAAAVSRPPRILHLIQNLVGGGGPRAMISLAKHSARLGGYEHRLVSLGAADSTGLDLARQAGLRVLNQPGRSALFQAMAEADVVLVHWWNNPDVATLFRRELPPARLALWLHVGGCHPPQVFSRPLIDFADLTVACSPHTYAHPAFTSLPEDFRRQRTAMVLAGAEFDRLQGLTPRAHEGFQVGYIGTVDPVKMHSGFVDMSCAVQVPDVKFVICGQGDHRWLATRAAELGRGASFDFRGVVEDIRGVLETLDVYGYPLCPDTYAAAELNLQEAMFAGLPVVTFPHGGIGKLVQHGETGLLVNTPEEYARAIERLHQDPAERARLGANAAAFARRFWGAESAAREFNVHFDRLLARPKRDRQWGVPAGAPVAELPPSLADRVSELAIHPGARLFLESLGDAAQPFLNTLTATGPEALFEADDQVAGMSRLMHQNGVICYRYLYPKDPFIQMWAGLGFLAADNFGEALDAFTQASLNGFNHWRVQWHRAVAAEHAGRLNDAADALQKLLSAAPDFAPARELQQRIAQTARPARRPAAPVPPGQLLESFLQQAQRFSQTGQFTMARDWIVRALNLAPRQLELIEMLAELDCRLGNLDAARKGCAAVLAADPLRKSPRLEQLHEFLGLKPKNPLPTQPPAADWQPFVQTAKSAGESNDQAALEPEAGVTPRFQNGGTAPGRNVESPRLQPSTPTQNHRMQNIFHSNGSNGHAPSSTPGNAAAWDLAQPPLYGLNVASAATGSQPGTVSGNSGVALLTPVQPPVPGGDLASVRRSLRSALASAPGDVPTLTALGNVCFQMGDFQEARAQFELALQLDPQNIVLHVQAATASHRLGDLAGVAKSLQQALTLDPNCEPALALLAGAHFQARRFGDAAEIYQLLVGRNPAHLDWLLALAKCRFQQGNLPGCRELYERVRRIQPGNPIALEALAILQNRIPAVRASSIADIVRENPALHRDHTGKPLTMPISNEVANFLRHHVRAGSRTIETGAGLSTLCFLAQGAIHTAIAPDPGLEVRMKEYCDAHGISHDRLTYIPKRSEDAVWALEGEFDCALIDGGHGFPIPFIDFFFLNQHLKQGGFLIIDDLEIWTGETLAKFLSCERAWKLVVQDGHRAIIFQKVGDARATEWTRQEFVVKSSLHPSYMETVIPREIWPPALAA